MPTYTVTSLGRTALVNQATLTALLSTRFPSDTVTLAILSLGVGKQFMCVVNGVALAIKQTS